MAYSMGEAALCDALIEGLKAEEAECLKILGETTAEFALAESDQLGWSKDYFEARLHRLSNVRALLAMSRKDLTMKLSPVFSEFSKGAVYV